MSRSGSNSIANSTAEQPESPDTSLSVSLDAERPNTPVAQSSVQSNPPAAPAQEEQAPSGVELSEAFKMVGHQFMRWGQFWFSNQRLSIPRVMVLKMVAEHGLRVGNHEGNLRMVDIAEEMGVTPRNITTIVDGLEREGLLVRRRDATDRRAIRLELTPQGKEQIAEIEQTMDTVSEQFFAPLDAAQRRQLLTILQTLGNAYNLPGEANCPADAMPFEGKPNIHDRMREIHERHRQRHHGQ